VDANLIRAVVTIVVTPKSGVISCFHCESLINGGKRAEDRPYIYHNTVKGYCYQQHTPVFLVTTELTTSTDSCPGRAPPGTATESYQQLGRWETVSPLCLFFWGAEITRKITASCVEIRVL
jgi:hypothetical protein